MPQGGLGAHLTFFTSHCGLGVPSSEGSLDYFLLVGELHFSQRVAPFLRVTYSYVPVAATLPPPSPWAFWAVVLKRSPTGHEAAHLGSLC